MLRNQIIDSAVSLSGSVNGTALVMDHQFEGFSLQAVVSSSSSLSGTIKLQAAIDTGASPVNWADIASSSATLTADGVTMWSVGRHHFRWVRIVYTSVGGSATMTTSLNENV